MEIAIEVVEDMTRLYSEVNGCNEELPDDLYYLDLKAYNKTFPPSMHIPLHNKEPDYDWMGEPNRIDLKKKVL